MTQMSPDRWQQIERLYHNSLERAPEHRLAFLDRACADDDELRREIESLLASHDDAGSFIDKPPDDVVAGMIAEEQAQSVIGRTLGHYQIRSLIGAGGMGEVYRARDIRLDRDVAVKLLPEHLATDSEALRRFEREAKAVAALSHPNILSIFDFGAEQSLSYAVMELLEGETLRARLQRGAIGWREAAEIGAAIAEGLAAAHAKGIIHRDLKPENVFLISDGQVKILDFGIARVKRVVSPEAETVTTGIDTTKRGVVMGTLGYMSPEQVRGETVEAPSDIFSFGCVLYEMIGGLQPFARATAAETIAAILKEEPPPLAATGREIPGGLERLIRACLEKQPSARLQSARDLAQGLKAVVDGRGTQKILPSLARPRRHLAAMIGAAVGVLLLGALAWLMLAGKREPVIDSLAVLPLAFAGSDEQAEILSDGISESIINSLSQLPQLKRVIARSTASRYKGKEVDPGTVGAELNVRAVLIGKMIRRGDVLIVEAELVNTADGTRLWGGQYPLKPDDALAVQAEIAKQISEKLRLRLSGAEQKRLTKRPTENPEAYLLYNSGRYHWGKDTKYSRN